MMPQAAIDDAAGRALGDAAGRALGDAAGHTMLDVAGREMVDRRAMVNLPQPDDSGLHETLAVETHNKGENMLVISLVGLWESFIIDSVIKCN